MNIENARVGSAHKTEAIDRGVVDTEGLVLPARETAESILTARREQDNRVARLLGESLLGLFEDGKHRVYAGHEWEGLDGGGFHHFRATVYQLSEMKVLGVPLPFESNKPVVELYLSASRSGRAGYQPGPLTISYIDPAIEPLVSQIPAKILGSLEEHSCDTYLNQKNPFKIERVSKL